MNIHIIYRVCDKVDAVNGLKRPFGLKKADVIKACYRSLVKSFGEAPWAMTVLADDVSEDTRDFISNNAPANFTLLDITAKVKEDKGVLPGVPAPFGVSGKGIFNTGYIRLVEAKPALKNAGSLLRSFEVADGIQDPETWIYFLEDDYLHDWNNFAVRLASFTDFIKGYKFAQPIFIHPTDYPDQYTRLLSRCYMFQTPFGYWREVSSTTCTFLCQAKTYRKFADHLKACNVDDGKLSTIFKKDAMCFSPLPSAAAHMHEGVMPAYVDWERLTKEALQEPPQPTQEASKETTT
jgi:hypothetical protein